MQSWQTMGLFGFVSYLEYAGISGCYVKVGLFVVKAGGRGLMRVRWGKKTVCLSGGW